MSDAELSLSEQLKQLLARIPYAQFIGMRAELAGDEMTAILPYSDVLIGNPTLPAIHGGVIGAFMEMTAVAQLSVSQGLVRQPRTIDITIEYLRSGRPVDTFARATIKRAGRRIANVQVEAWQDSRAAPIAALHGHFLITPKDDNES
jgi:acyl-coenzyme A thioesterase PaaI-like protein